MKGILPDYFLRRSNKTAAPADTSAMAEGSGIHWKLPGMLTIEAGVPGGVAGEVTVMAKGDKEVPAMPVADPRASTQV